MTLSAEVPVHHHHPHPRSLLVSCPKPLASQLSFYETKQQPVLLPLPFICKALSINPRVIYSFLGVNYVLHAVLHDRQSLLHCWTVIVIGKSLLKVLISDTCDRSDKRDHVNCMMGRRKVLLKEET